MTLVERITAAIEARRRLRERPAAETAQSLARAATLWRNDAELRMTLPSAIGLTPPVVAAGIAHTAAAFDATVMTALARTELVGLDPIETTPVVAEIVASNVPALALPAIAHGCLAGAAVIVKSGRRDPLSAPAFVHALASVDPELAATVVAADWRGADPAREAAVFERATVAVVTGSDATVEALALRAPIRVVAHWTRTSAVALDASGLDDTQATAEAIARDVALYDQRGCLSPHVVWVAGDARAFAVELASALDAAEADLPMAEASLEERAAVRVALDEAEWQGATVLRAAAGAVVYDPRAEPQPAIGGRVVRVQPLRALDALTAVLPRGRVECVAIAGGPVPAGLLELGVSRVCRPGRMQRPTLAWPRGQQAPLRTLLQADTPPMMEVET